MALPSRRAGLRRLHDEGLRAAVDDRRVRTIALARLHPPRMCESAFLEKPAEGDFVVQVVVLVL